MNFLIYDADGRVLQSNKIFDWQKRPGNGRAKDHDKFLRDDMGQTFITVDSPVPLSVDEFMVHKGQAKQREHMRISVNKRKIAAGENDPLILDGIPPKSRVVVRVQSISDLPIYDGVVTGGKLEMPFIIPGIYNVEVERFPHKPWRLEVEVHQ